LAPRAGERLWDIGCGSGSVSIEWMLAHPANTAIAFEADQVRAARAARNATSLGVPDLRIEQGRAPQVLAGLPQPDAVFIGGGARDPEVISAVWAALRAGGRLVANAVTLETEGALIAARERLGGTLTRLSVERLESVGRLHAFRPAMSVTQWTAVKP
jgi:precorrin-6Y C5,15-methyltransferase (decarboxylating)